MQRIYFRLDWRDYFRVSANQLKTTTKGHKIEIYTKLYKEIKSAIGKRLNEQMIALDPSTRTIISISKTDFEEVLLECKKFLESAEEYESCADIRDMVEKLHNKPKGKREKKVQKLVLIKSK